MTLTSQEKFSVILFYCLQKSRNQITVNQFELIKSFAKGQASDSTNCQRNAGYIVKRKRVVLQVQRYISTDYTFLLEGAVQHFDA